MWQTEGFFPEGVECPDSADAEDDFLLNAGVRIAAVEPCRDGPVVRRVFGDVRVEQIERHPSDLNPPDAKHHLPPRQRGRDEERLPFRVEFGNQREGEEVVFRIPLLLPAVHVQVLAEVAFAVHERDADEWHAEVAGTFQVIPG